MDATDQAFNKLRKQLSGVRHILDRQNFLVELMADNNKALNDKLDSLQATVDDVQSKLAIERQAKADAKAAQDALITDLRAQLAAGPTGLTEDQVNTAISRIQTISDDILTTENDSTSTPVTTPPGGQTSEPGETPVSH